MSRNRLRQLRTERGLTQRDLALQAGVPASTVSRIDSVPSTKIELDVAWRLAAALKIDPRELLQPTSESKMK